MKKKLFSRISALFMSLILLVSMFSVLALAEGETTTRLIQALPDTSKSVSLTIHKYDSDITKDENGDLVHGTGNEIDKNDISKKAAPVEGVEFTVERVTLDDAGGTYTVKDINGVDHKYKPYGEKVVTGLTDANGVVVFDKNAADQPLAQGTYYVTETNSATTGRSPIQPFVVELPMTNPDYVDGNIDESGSAWIYDVHVYPKNQPIPFDKSVEEINNHSTNNYIGQIQKWIITSVIPRDLVAATVSDANTEKLRDKQEYSITDYMDPRLTFVETVDSGKKPNEPTAPKYAGETLTVTVFSKYLEANQIPTPEDEESATMDAFAVLEKDTDYTVTPTVIDLDKDNEDDVKDPDFKFNGRTKIVIALTDEGFNKIGAMLGAVKGVEGTPELYIGVNIYSCINDKIYDETIAAAQGDDYYLGQDIPNDAVLNFKNQYTPNGNTGVTVPSPTSYTHTGGITISKFDSKDNSKKLPGAIFAIASSEDNAKNGYFLQKKTINGVSTILDLGDPGYDETEWNTATGSKVGDALFNKIYTSTTGTDGLAGFFGLEYGARVINCGGAATACTDENRDGIYDKHGSKCEFTQGDMADGATRDYWIVELVSPKIMEYVQNEDGSFTLKDTGKYYNLLDNPEKVTISETSHNAGNEKLIPNSAGFKLPTTGGIGTTILTVAGSALMVSAAIFFFVLKRKNKKSDRTAA